MEWPTPKDRARSALFERYPPTGPIAPKDHQRVARRVAALADWDDEDDWSFEEERPMTTRSHHKKPAPTRVPNTPTTKPVEPKAPLTPEEWQNAVLARLDETNDLLYQLLCHMRGEVYDPMAT
jgi:hypothetical protein